MGRDILVIAEHSDGQINDISYEMTGRARALAAALGGQVVVALAGSGLAGAVGSFASDRTLVVDAPALAQFNPEAYGRVAAALMAELTPRLTLVGSTTMGMDLGAWLAARSEQAFAAYVSDLAVEDEALVVTSQLFAGKMAAETVPAGEGLVAAVLAGAFPAEAGRGTTAAEVRSSPVDLGTLKTRFVAWQRPEAGDVDITAQDKLVSVGRGIGGADNIELAQELADALGAALAASRPVTDAGWLPKTRQVGKSGVTVKPKLYLMLGISGAPEHLEGMKDAELIIAVNSDAGAPIFGVAHYGTTADLFDVAEALLELLE